jgi:hypothetical protein
MKKYFVVTLLTVALTVQAATPTFAQVEETMQENNYKKARVMLNEVLRKRPESVRAHTLNARLIAAEGGDIQEVQDELNYVTRLKNPTPVEDTSVLRNVMLFLCTIATIMTLTLATLCGKIWYRNRVKESGKCLNVEQK